MKRLGYIFGDHGYSHKTIHKTILYSMRACVSAAYLLNGISDRLLARPLHKQNETYFLEDFVNTKTDNKI